MLERSLEILVRLCARSIFDEGWELRAQQLGLPSGRLDLLFADGDGILQVIEVKKGRAVPAALEQATRYAADIREFEGPTAVVPWVVAHEIPARLKRLAAPMGVNLCEVSLSRCEELMRKHQIDEATLLGERRDGTVLSGGGAKRGLRNPVENDVALAEMPPDMATLLITFSGTRHVDMASGGMQTVLHYKGVKLGGVNRKHRGGVAYVATGVVLSRRAEERLKQLGFKQMTKTQAGHSHEHVWWEAPWRNVDGFSDALVDACSVVDAALSGRRHS